MSIELPKPTNDGPNDFKTQRTEQSEFDYNTLPMALNTVGNVNYNLNRADNIPPQDNGKIVLDTFANETLKIKVTPSEGKKTIVQIIKRDDKSVLDCNTLHIGAVIKNNDELPDDYQGDGKFHLYKNLINKEKPFRRSFSPCTKVTPQTSLEDYHPQLINQSSAYSNASNCECCLAKPVNDTEPAEPACVNVSNTPCQPDQLDKLYTAQSISNNANFKILYDKPYATAEFDDQYLSKSELQKTDDNIIVKCVKSVINEASKMLDCLACGQAIASTCGPNFINPFTTCNYCFLQKQTKIKHAGPCSSCRSDPSFPDKPTPATSGRYEVYGPNIYRVSAPPSEPSVSPSDYNLVPLRLKDSVESELIPFHDQPIHTGTIEPKQNNCFPYKYFSCCTCQKTNPDRHLSINQSIHKSSIDSLNSPHSGPVTPLGQMVSANRSISSTYFSTMQSGPQQYYSMAEPITTERTTGPSSPHTTRSLLQKVDPQLVKESLKQRSQFKPKTHGPGVIGVQKCKFDFSQNIPFDRIIKYPHILLTIDNICNVERIDRVLITSGNFILYYKDLCLKGLRVPTVKLDQTSIKLAFEISQPTTAASRLLMHCGVAQKKKIYRAQLPLDLSDPTDAFGTIPLTLHGSTDKLDDCDAPTFAYKIRKFTHGLCYMTCLPSLQTKFQYVSLYGDQLDELVSSLVNNLPNQARNYVFKQMDEPNSYVINGVFCKLTFSGDIYVRNDYYQGKLSSYLQQIKPQTNTNPMLNETISFTLYELPLFAKLLENTFSEWAEFVLPGKDIFVNDELLPTLKAHATAMTEELLIRLVEYLDGPVLHPNFNKYLVPPVLYYNEDVTEIDNSNYRAVFTYLWHFDACKNMVGNAKVICKSDYTARKNEHKMDREYGPQITFVELSDVCNTSDGLKIVNNIIEKEVQRILSFRNGHNDFIASIEEEIKLLTQE